MTSKRTLGLARQWAADIDADRETLSQDTIDAAADLISSLPDQWVDAEKLREVVADHHIDMSEELMEALGALLPTPPAPESASPRPEDVPVGEPWQVEVNGKAAVGYRNAPEGKISWTIVYRDDYIHDWAYDSGVTLIARLVPETAKQDDAEQGDEQEFDPAYTYSDRHGDVWYYEEEEWWCYQNHYRTFRANGTPPAEFSPYTRIEENEK